MVVEYDIDAGGRLTPSAHPDVESGSGASDVVVSSDGRRAYVGNYWAGTVSQFDIGPDGVLTPRSPATVGANDALNDLALSPDGRTLYAVSIVAGGVPAPVAVPAGDTPYALAISPDGSSLYVTNTNSNTANPTLSVTQFDIRRDGRLRPMRPPTVQGPAVTVGIAVTELPERR